VREFILVAHKWLGIVSSLVVGIAGFTGALLVFRTDQGAGLILKLHEDLALGQVGWGIVVLASVGAVVLQASGVYLWWKRKSWRIRTDAGWRRLAFDLHHTAGALGCVLMIVIAATGAGRVAVRVLDFTDAWPSFQAAVTQIHTTKGFSTPMKVLFFLGSLGFCVQALTGIAMFWPKATGRNPRA
jgi:uncharacterized iron-regulated membrane protein